tara:strand:- start:4 stop:231 length:228 start_codon:yes stop_codon:yes gene_type:complete
MGGNRLNYETEYESIPLIVLEGAGFPTNAAWLTDGQRRLLEFIYDEYYKEIYTELQRCKEYIEELEDELNDKERD